MSGVARKLISASKKGVESLLLVATNAAPFFFIYGRTGDTFTQLPALPDMPPIGGGDLSLSGDDNYLALAGTPLALYLRSGDTFTKIANPAVVAPETARVAFSSDGTYLVIGHQNFALPSGGGNSGLISFYKRTGVDTFTKLANPPIGDQPNQQVTAIDFSSDDTYVAMTNTRDADTGTPFIIIYKRTGDTFTKVANPNVLFADTAATGVRFSSLTTYLAMGQVNNPHLVIYKRSGDAFTKLPDPSALPDSIVSDAAWTSDDIYLAAADFFPSSIIPDLSAMVIYKRSGDTFTKLPDPAGLPDRGGTTVDFSSDDTYLALGGSLSDAGGANPLSLVVFKRSGDTFTKLADPDPAPSGSVGHLRFSNTR